MFHYLVVLGVIFLELVVISLFWVILLSNFVVKLKDRGSENNDNERAVYKIEFILTCHIDIFSFTFLFIVTSILPWLLFYCYYCFR